MAVDTAALLAYLASLTDGISGMDEVFTGVPESISVRQAAYVTVGAQRETDLMFSIYGIEADFLITLVYAVGNAEGPAETWIAQSVDALRVALHADRDLGGLCKDIRIDLGLAASAEYEAVLGVEFRRFPIRIVTQHEVPH